MMNKKLIKLIEAIFTKKLQSKTGWGKNDVLKIYKDSVNEALLELMN